MITKAHSPDRSGILFCHGGGNIFGWLRFVRNDKKDIADSGIAPD